MKASAEELRPLFLFEHLNDEQLAWLSAEGTVRDYAAGELICAEGDFAEFLFVLLDGEVSLAKTVQDDVVQLTRSARPGVYGGATQSYLGDRIEQTYQHTLRATAPSRVFRLPGGRFAIAVREWFPMAMHLLEGLFFGMSNTRQLIDQRERLTALGPIPAGLTHELNNPASAAARSSAELGERIRTARRRLAELATSGADIAALVAVQERLTEREAQIRRPMEISDAEGELSDWLEDHEVEEAWEIAPTLVTGEFGIPDAEELAASMGDGLPVAVRWLADALEISQLEAEISEAVKRISGLLTSAKQYSQLDRAAYQTVDLRELLASTLTVGTVTARSSRSATADPASPPRTSAGSSPRSSPPRRSGTVPGSASTSPGGSSSTGTTATSGSSPSRETPGSRSCCPWPTRCLPVERRR